MSKTWLFLFPARRSHPSLEGRQNVDQMRFFIWSPFPNIVQVVSIRRYQKICFDQDAWTTMNGPVRSWPSQLCYLFRIKTITYILTDIFRIHQVQRWQHCGHSIWNSLNPAEIETVRIRYANEFTPKKRSNNKFLEFEILILKFKLFLLN